MDLDEFLANPLASVAKRQRRREPIAEEMDPSLMRRLTNAGMSGLAMVGNVLDIPGSMVRDTLAGENPFDQLAPWNWTSGENRVGGKELLQRYGLIGRRSGWTGTLAGFAADIALDPTTYLTGGASALSKAGKLGKMAGILDDITSIRPVGMRQGRLSTTLGDLVANNPAAREALERTAAAAGETLTPELMGQQLGGLWKAHGPLAFLNNEAGVIGKAGGKAEAFARTLDTTARTISESAPGRMVSSLFEHAVRGQYGRSAQKLARLVTKNQQKYGPMGRAGALDVGDQVNPVLDELAGTPGVADEIMAARRRELVQPYEEQLANAAESVKLRGNYDQRVKEFVDAKQAELDAATEYSPETTASAAPTAAPEAAKTLSDRVFDSYFELTGGASNHRVRLSDLRDKLGVTPEELTKELMDLERAGKIALYPLNHSLEIGPKDIAAAINNSAGSPRHVIYIVAKDRPIPIPQQSAASAAPTATPSGKAKRQTYKLTKEDNAAIVRDIKNIRANLDEATKRVSIANSVFDSLDKATEVRRVLNDVIRHTGEKDINDAMKVFGIKLPANAQQSIGSAVDVIRTFNKELVDEINRLGGGVRLLGEDDTGEVLSYMTRYVDVSRLSRSDRQAIAEALNLEAKRLGVEVNQLPPNVVKQVTEEMSPARSWQAGSTKTAVDMARSHETRKVPAKIVNDLLTDPNLRVEPGDQAGLVAAAEYILDNYVDYLDTAYTGRSKHQIAYDLAKWAEKNKGQPGFPGMMEKRAKLFSTPDAKNSLEQHALELAQWVRLHPRRKMYTHDVMTDAMRYAEAGHRKVGMLKSIHEYLRQSAKGFLSENLEAEAKRLGVNVQDLAPDVVERVTSETRRSTVPLARVYEEAGMDVESSLKHFAKDGNLTPEQLNRLTVDPEVAQAVAAVIRSDPQSPWGKAIGKFIDEVNGFMRANLTLPFPSFHMRNLSSGQYVNFATGAINSPEDMKRYMDAVQVARAMAKDTNNPQYRSYLREMEVYRVHGAQSGERMATGSEDVPLNPFIPLPESLKQSQIANAIDTGYQNVMQLGSKAMQTVEYYNRVPLYIYYRRKGYEPAAAALEVKKRHFDYTELAPAERELFKRGFLFYSFTRKMAPLVVQTLMERPGGALAQSIKTAAKLHDDQDTPIPNWIRETTAIPLGGTADGTKRFITGLGLPQEDVFSFLPSPMQELLSRTTPPIKAAAELSFGRSLFQRGRPLEDLDPNLGRTLANIRQLAGGPKADVRAKPLFGSQGLEFLAANSPLSRAISSVRTLTDPRKTWTDAGINFLTGARITDVSAGAQEAELQEAANRMIKRLGGRTFQTTYIPTEEQATMTPEELQEFAGLQMLQRQIAARARERRKRRLAAEGTNTTP